MSLSSRNSNNTKPIRFHLRGFKYWPPVSVPEVGLSTPLALRRRVTLLGQRALNAAWPLEGTDKARYILSSRHGEFGRTLSLLESVVSKSELSPADFTMSVHHALLGLLSIVQKNRCGHTAVAAGNESFCLALMEAAACLHENPNQPIILIHFDDLLPGAYASFNEVGEQPIALALLMSAAGEGEDICVSFEPSSSQGQPAIKHAKDFLDFLTNGDAEGKSVGENRLWHWTRHAGD